MRHAKRANKIAITNNFLEKEARSVQLIAHAEESLGNNIVATEEFTKASEIYKELGQIDEMLKIQCFAAISKGKPDRIDAINTNVKLIALTARDVIDPYIELVLKSDKEKFGRNKYMKKLLDWELGRVPFWDSIIDGKPVVSMTDTTYSGPDEELNTFTWRSSNISSVHSLARARNPERRKSVFLESVNKELTSRSESLK